MNRSQILYIWCNVLKLVWKNLWVFSWTQLAPIHIIINYIDVMLLHLEKRLHAKKHDIKGTQTKQHTQKKAWLVTDIFHQFFLLFGKNKQDADSWKKKQHFFWTRKNYYVSIICRWCLFFLNGYFLWSNGTKTEQILANDSNCVLNHSDFMYLLLVSLLLLWHLSFSFHRFRFLVLFP